MSRIEAAWKVLAAAREHELPIPLCLTFSLLSERITVQVEESDFRTWYDAMSVEVSTTLDHEQQVHVRVEGTLLGADIELVTVIDSPEQCELSVDGWCATHSSRRGPVYCKAVSS